MVGAHSKGSRDITIEHNTIYDSNPDGRGAAIDISGSPNPAQVNSGALVVGNLVMNCKYGVYSELVNGPLYIIGNDFTGYSLLREDGQVGILVWRSIDKNIFASPVLVNNRISTFGIAVRIAGEKSIVATNNQITNSRIKYVVSRGAFGRDFTQDYEQISIEDNW